MPEVTRLNNAEPMRLLRIERNIRLAKTDFMALSDVTMTEIMENLQTKFT